MRVVMLAVLLVLSACDSGGSKTAAQIQAEVQASQQAFEANRRRIAAENKAREARLAVQRSYVSARFVSVDEAFLEVELRNETTKDIDNIIGSLEAVDDSGNIVTNIALTNWVPGDIYLPAGATTPARKNLRLETAQRRQQLLEQASGYQFFYTTLRIQFASEEEINYQQPALSPAPLPVVKSEPINQAKPEDCESDQLTLETAEIYYPGPKCEHIARNMDSERFKLEYINRCKTELGITAHLPAVARVQLSSCVYETSRPGLVYSKRICCDRPR